MRGDGGCPFCVATAQLRFGTELKALYRVEGTSDGLWHVKNDKALVGCIPETLADIGRIRLLRWGRELLLVDGLMEAAYRVHLANPAAMQQYSG